MATSVLLVSEDVQLRRLLAAALGGHGHQVLEAGSGAEARRLIESARPDLLVVDERLPDVQGIHWIEQLRAEGIRLPIVFLSAFWREMTVFHHLTKDLGVALVIYKPIEPEEFGDKIDLALGGASPPPALEPPSSLQQQLLALKQEYARELPQKLDAFADTLRAARTDPELFDDIIAQAHRLRGTAGSYGFARVSSAAAHLEDLLQEVRRSAAAPRRGLWEEVDNALADLRAAGTTLPAPLLDPPPPGEIPFEQMLLVDADPAFNQAVATMARRQMINIVPARSTAEALDKARGMKFSAAIIDARVDGQTFELAGKLRSLDGYRNLPLAFVSTDETLENRVAAAHAGASLFLKKPITPEEFAEAAEQLRQAAIPERDRVLVVVDDDAFTLVLQAILAAEGVLVRVLADPTRLFEVLEEFRPHLLLLDTVLPQISGLDACRAVRTSQRWQTLPILFLTARTDVRGRLEAFRAGGNDFLTRPVIPEELVARVRVRLDQARLLRERTERDAVSGLLLRRPFLEGLGQRLAEAQRRAGALSLAMLDLDRFKAVNDAHGHLIGDQVIASLGHLLNRRFRVEDLRGRWGGEEFIVAFPGQPPALATGVLQRVLLEFSELPFQAEGGQSFNVSFTAGIAGFPEDGTTVQALIHCADQRLYLGKHHGRGCIVGPEGPPPRPGRGPVSP